MKYEDIAIIGFSGRFAGINNIEEFRDFLSEKKCAISDPDPERLSLMKQSEDEEYMKSAYLKDISLFDNDFFNISKRDARLMSPEQRISLELVAETILSAGYSLKEFAGADCGVYIAGGESKYNNYIEKQSSSSIIGSKSFMLGGQISYHFDLRGENYSVDSGCSSALTAIHQACEKLTIGEMTTALAGGVILESSVPVAKKNEYDNLGIMSPDYSIRSFDENANGTVSGEGGGFVLLKRLDRAKKDGDHIYGVLVGGALNSDGGRCESVSMPSVEAQGDVVLNAWEDIDVSDLTEIEAHGIGALVGDAVEAQSLIDAVIKRGLDENEIKLSTAKSNIGHLFALSGIAAVIKTLVGYKYNETYPIANLEKVNPMINFEKGGITPLKEVYHWEPDKKRMTGISAFGLNGCNAHIVMRNHINEKKEFSDDLMIKISAHSRKSFEGLKHAYLADLSSFGDLSPDFGYTANTGRDDYDLRALVYANGIANLKNALVNAVPQEHSEDNKCEVIFAFKTERIKANSITDYYNVLPNLKYIDHYLTGNEDTDYKLMLYKALKDAGISSKIILTDAVFGAGMKLCDGDIEPEAFKKILADTVINDNCSAFIEQIKKKAADKPAIIIDFTVSGMIRTALSDSSGTFKSGLNVFHMGDPEEVKRLIKFWYEEGFDINWSGYYGRADNRRIPIPTYTFDRKRFWIDVSVSQAEVAKKEPVAQGSKKEIPGIDVKPEKRIFVLTREHLKDADVRKFPYKESGFRASFSPETSDISIDGQLAMLRYVKSKGIRPDIILADKQGKSVYDFAKGKVSREILSDRSSDDEYTDVQKILRIVNEKSNGYNTIVFYFGQNNILQDAFSERNIKVIPLFNEGALELYINSPELFFAESSAENRTMVKERTDEKDEKQEEQSRKSKELIEAEDFLEKTWAKAFNLDGDIGHDEDFFALGGNSLIMQSMSDEINKHFNKKFDIFEIYDYETIEKLAEKILEDE